jgi:hypothetical protein
MTGINPFAQHTSITSFMKALKERQAIPKLPSEGINKRVRETIQKGWDYEGSKRPKASDICRIFAKVGFKDHRPPTPSLDKSRVRSDGTVINYDGIYETLRRVCVTVYPL